MSESAKEKAKAKKTRTRRPLIIAGVIVIIAILITPFGYLAAMNGRVMPWVTVNGLALGGLTKNEAAAKLNAAVNIYENSGLNFTNGKRTVAIDATQVPGGDPDAAHQILNVDTDAGLSAAYAVGRAGNPRDPGDGRLAQHAGPLRAAGSGKQNLQPG